MVKAGESPALRNSALSDAKNSSKSLRGDTLDSPVVVGGLEHGTDAHVGTGVEPEVEVESPLGLRISPCQDLNTYIGATVHGIHDTMEEEGSLWGSRVILQSAVFLIRTLPLCVVTSRLPWPVPIVPVSFRREVCMSSSGTSHLIRPLCVRHFSATDVP